jgi:glycosyltransferase involved in cell wall biosynthesis
MMAGAYAPEISAGGLQCRAVANLLKGRAVVTVLTTATDSSLPSGELVDGIPVRRVPVNRHNRWSSLAASAGLLRELVSLVPAVDVVHIQGYSTKNILATAVAKVTGRPVMVHLQTSLHDEPETVRRLGSLAWWAFSSADYYLSVSRGLAQKYLAAGLPADRIREVPNGVDAVRFSPASLAERVELRQRLDLPADGKVVLFVGVVSPDKQPHILLDAWIRTQRDPALASTLVLVGATDPTLFELGGRLIDQLRATAAASGFGDRVVFVPPTNQIQDYFRAADMYVMPSKREGMPIALLEAMACGLPCVASRLPGATDTMVDDGVNGRLAEPGDIDGFAAAIGGLLADPATASRMGAAARRTVEDRYTMERVADMWLDAYQHVLARR